MAPACMSPLGCPPEQNNVAGPARSLAAGITAGPGQDGQCLELCICVYIHLYLHRHIPIYVYTYICMCVYNYDGGFFPLPISFLHLQAFLRYSVLQLLPKGHNFGFRLTKINSLQEIPNDSKPLSGLAMYTRGYLKWSLPSRCDIGTFPKPHFPRHMWILKRTIMCFVGQGNRVLYISHRKRQGEMEPLNSTQELCPSAFYFFHGKRERH